VGLRREAEALDVAVVPGIERSAIRRKARDYIGHNPHSQDVDPNCSLPIPGEPSLTSAPCIVFDTNVVLDWLLFGDPAMTALASAVTGRRLCWIASPAMRDELAHVLDRGLAVARGRDTALVLRAWDQHVTPRPPAAAHPMRCRDADDQIFVDLALGAGASWLVSRDRAVLALRRQAARVGLRILRPIDWPPE
jgi:predicted nucleic acid-binding protein